MELDQEEKLFGRFIGFNEFLYVAIRGLRITVFLHDVNSNPTVAVLQNPTTGSSYTCIIRQEEIKTCIERKFENGTTREYIDEPGVDV